MQSFISKVISHVVSEESTISDFVFVTPSQRASLFVKNEIINTSVKPDFLPKIVTIENFIQEVSGLTLIDNTQLLFEFYKVYKKTNKEPETIDVFSQWGTTVLKDFNEIDSYLVHPKSFFETLSDIKKLDEWFPKKSPSKLAKDYLSFFNSLFAMYSQLSAELLKNKVGYQGLIYRYVIENISTICKLNKDKIVFVGFNALNKAEETLITTFLDKGKAKVYWDANEHILNSKNEAGVFLRKYKEEWSFYKNTHFLFDMADLPKNQQIKCIGAPKNVAQIKYVGELLSSLTTFRNTAVVLSDEKLLGLLLNSIPSNVSGVNITMGYNLTEVSASNLFELVFKIYNNKEKLSFKNQNGFYYKDVLELLTNPFIYKLYKEKIHSIAADIKRENTVFLTSEKLTDIFLNLNLDASDVLLQIFTLPEDVNEILQQLISIIEKLKNEVKDLESEYLYAIYTIFKKLETFQNSYHYFENRKILSYFFKQIIQFEKLSFQGEPLEGLQLMGMLETRALDFENVIITSVNEGILPGNKNEKSFIPFDVRMHFGLPTFREKDAIFSYHFQRLLSRASNVYLLYNTETDGYGSGEKSRFITKLLIENPKVESILLSPKVSFEKKQLNEIEKTPEIIEKLNDVVSKGISPSSLTTYINNPIKFYEQKILKVKEYEEVEENIELNTMGSVIHDVLEELYVPFKGKYLEEKNIDSMLEKIDFLAKKCFSDKYKIFNIEIGKNRLVYEAAISLLSKFLQSEKKLLSNTNNKLKIIDLELKLSSEVTIENCQKPIVLTGIIDRVDQLNGVTRIIDYKTGNVEGLTMPKNYEEITTDYAKNKILQLLLYSYLYSSNTNCYQTEAGIISFKSLSDGLKRVNFGTSYNPDFIVTKEKLENFINEIKKLLNQIVDPSIPFIENPNKKY